MFENLFAQSGLSLERLKTFRDIVAAGGVTAAAGDDSNRQSQFSRQLKELEKYFGCELLKRGRGPAKLTDAGKQLYEIVGRTLAALEEFRAGCASQTPGLTIGAGESMIQWLLLPQLAHLTKAHPQLAITFQNLRTDEVLDGLADGSLDFGIVGRIDARRIFASASLGKLSFSLFVPKRLLSNNARLKHSSTILDKLPLAMLEGSPAIREALLQETQRLGVKPDVRFHFSSYPQLAGAVANCEVAAIMPQLAASSFDPSAIHVIQLPFLKNLSRDICVVWNRQMAEVRPAIAKYSRVLPPIFRMQNR